MIWYQDNTLKNISEYFKMIKFKNIIKTLQTFLQTSKKPLIHMGNGTLFSLQNIHRQYLGINGTKKYERSIWRQLYWGTSTSVVCRHKNKL